MPAIKVLVFSLLHTLQHLVNILSNFYSGFVGEGMLTAAVAGSVFASPPPSHILTAICNVAAVSPGKDFAI